MFKRTLIVAAVVAGLVFPALVLAQTTPPSASLIVTLAPGLTVEQQAAVVERNGGAAISSVAR